MNDMTDKLLRDLAVDIQTNDSGLRNATGALIGGPPPTPFGAKPLSKRIDLVEASAASAEAMDKIFNQVATDTEALFNAYERHTHDFLSQLDAIKSEYNQELEQARHEAGTRAQWIRDMSAKVATLIANHIDIAARVSAANRDTMAALGAPIAAALTKEEVASS